MNRLSSFAPFFAATLFIGAAPRSHAEADTTQEIVAVLHEAEASPTPLPLLDKAKTQLEHFNPRPALGRANARQRNGVNAGAEKHKEEAVKALDEAIARAKAAANLPSPPAKAPLGTAMDKPAGADLKALIENAIAKVHMAGEAKR